MGFGKVEESENLNSYDRYDMGKAWGKHGAFHVPSSLMRRENSW